jgi:endonuclease YncB( thermonuclease family)
MKKKPPERGLVTDAVVVRIIDGDTLVVQPLLPEMSIRLEDCWAPELRAKDPEVKAAAIDSANNLRRLLMAGQRVTLQIPGSHRASDLLTFGRFVGDVWFTNAEGDLQSVAETQVEKGHATRTKGGAE